ncbi:MAG: alkaline phosphatase family protein, partial [Thermotogota bacterium]
LKKIKTPEKKKKVILFVIDAMGRDNLQIAAQNSPILRKELESYEKEVLTSVFPSTTTAALTSYNTALPPLEHGMLGYTLFLPDYSSLVNMILLSPPELERDALTQCGLNPMKFLTTPTIFESLQETGVKCWTITSDLFVESGLTKMHHKGSAKRSYSGMLEMFCQLLKTVEEEDSKTFIFVYWGLTDTDGHHYGTHSRPYQGGIEYLFKMLRHEVLDRLSQQRLAETLFLISSDHGQIDTTWQDEEWITSEDELFVDYVYPPLSGEPRALYLNVKEPERFIEYFHRRFSKRFHLIEKNKAIALNLFSNTDLPHSILERALKENMARIGDYIAIAKEGYSLHFKHHGKTYTLKGKHGSLTREELLVPLLIYS